MANNVAKTITLDAARFYIETGWSVIPIEPQGKRPPKTRGGGRFRWGRYQKERADEKTAAAWVKRWPGCNVGIATGAVSGLVVLDIDGPEGEAEIKRRGGLPETPTVTTGKGRHIYFRHPGGTIRNFARRLPGLDLRGDGGYVVAPPSVHESGRRYEWEIKPSQVDLADLPDWLAALIHGDESQAPEPTPAPTPSRNGHDRYFAKALADELDKVRRAVMHTRNDTLFKAACNLGELVAGGLGDRHEVERLFLDAALAAGLGEPEAVATIRSGLNTGVKSPRTPPERTNDSTPVIPPDKSPRTPLERGRQTPRRIGARLPGDLADAVKGIAPQAPDPGLVAEIEAALLQRTEDGRRYLPALIRRKNAGRLMLAWLSNNGGFVQSESEELFYFYEPDRQLLNLATNKWAAWLYAVTGVNPASKDYAHLMADCEAAALSAPKREIVRVAAWDDNARILRVSRFDGTVYILDGETIAEEPNGAHVLFYDASSWIPYTPSFTTPGALEYMSALPNWKGKKEAKNKDTSQQRRKELTQEIGTYSLAFRVWILTSYFTELCPSRPHLVFLGEKGSGKSTALRLFLKLVFGPTAELSGVPDKPDGFTAAAAVSHILVLDNLDQFNGWLRDKLARIATGAEDHYRKLYTNNELGRVIYRCWLAFTARTPDTLRRDDLADRLVLLPVDRLDDENRENETALISHAAFVRNDWWGDVLTRLNTAVAAIRRGELSSQSKLRMADWETLGRLLAGCEDNKALWDDLVETIKQAQSDFLLEGDLLTDGLELWMQEPGNHGREVTSRELYSDLTYLLFEDKKPPKDWPKSVSAFGKRLAGIRRELRQYYTVKWYSPGKRKLLYLFKPKKRGNR